MKTSILTAVAALAATVSLSAQDTLRISLEQCRAMALQSSEQMQRATNSVEQSNLDLGVARTAMLPQIEASANAIWSLPDHDMSGYTLRMRGVYMAGLSLTQPLYVGGKISTANKLAHIGTAAAQEQARLTRMQTIYDADNAYWSYIAVAQKVQMLEAYKRQLAELYQATDVSVNAEMATRNDLLRVGSKQSQIEYQLQKAQNGLELCRMSLCSAIGVGFDTAIMPTDTAVACATPVISGNDMSAVPELRLLGMQLDAQEAQVKMVRADYLPTVALSASYSMYGNIKMVGTAQDADGNPVSFEQKTDGDGFTVIASAQIPLFHWGEGAKSIRKARLGAQNAKLEMQQTERQLIIRAQQAEQNLVSGYQMVGVAEVAMQQSDENLRVQKATYAAGLCTLTDLLDAQSQWHEAYSTLIEARTQYKLYESDYLKAFGMLGE